MIEEERQSESASSKLTIEGASSEDTGSYVCVASNAHGQRQSTVFLRIQGLFDVKDSDSASPLGSRDRDLRGIRLGSERVDMEGTPQYRTVSRHVGAQGENF